MRDPSTLAGFYLALESEPDDPTTLLALADWHDEHGELDASACLRWVVANTRFPFRYRVGSLSVRHLDCHEGWFWWATPNPTAESWGHPLTCQLPRPLWDPLRHSFRYTPSVFKEYPSARAAYSALLEAWPRRRPASKERSS